MGMFDEIEIHCEVPGLLPPDRILQTKDLENVLDRYEITADGRLIHHVRADWITVDDETAFFGFYMKPTREYTEEVPHHGDICGLGILEQKLPIQTVEYRFRFSEGQLIGVIALREEPRDA